VLAPPGGTEINFRGVWKVIYVAVKGERKIYCTCLYFILSNQVLAKGRVLDCLGVTKRGTEVEKGKETLL